MEEAHLAQKTLHNFRVRLMEHYGGRLAFSETTDRMIEALGLRTGKQRLDSTHVEQYRAADAVGSVLRVFLSQP